MPIETPATSSKEEPRNLVNAPDLGPWLENIAAMKWGPASQRDEREALGAKWLMTVGRKAVMKSGVVKPHEPGDVSAEPEWVQKAIAENKAIQALELGAADRLPLERALDWLVGPDGPATESDWSRISLSAALESEAKWIDELVKKSEDSRLDEAVKAGTKPISGLEGLESSELGPSGAGHSWVELTSAEALEREGGLMRHCVGIYARLVRSGKSRIFSLRDPAGLPLATVELASGCFKQLKLKGDNQSDAFCALAARALIERIAPELIAAGLRPSCGPDFVRAGYGQSNILGFCDLSKPLDEAGRRIVKQWLSTFGQITSEVQKELRQAAQAGGVSLFKAIERHGGDWHDNDQILLALFGSAPMLQCLEMALDRHAKHNQSMGLKTRLKKRHNQQSSPYIAKGITSGSEGVWSVLTRLWPAPAHLVGGIDFLARDPASIGDADLARFIRWIPVASTLEWGSNQWLGDTIERLAQARFQESLTAFRERLGNEAFPWRQAAAGAATTDSVGVLKWVLSDSPKGADLSRALANSLSYGAKRCVALLEAEPRAHAKLGAAIEAVAILPGQRAVEGLAALEKIAKAGALGQKSYIQTLVRASSNPKNTNPASLAWLMARTKEEPDFAQRLEAAMTRPSGKAAFSVMRSLGEAQDDPTKAAQGLAELCGQHFDAQTLARICQAQAQSGNDRAAALLWTLALGKPDAEEALSGRTSAILATAARHGCDALFAAAGGCSSDLTRSGVSFQKAMGMGCWGMALALAERKPELAEEMKDTLIHAAPYAPIETIQALLNKCDPKRNNSQALVAAARAGRLDAVEILAPLSDPKAGRSEALRSAAAKGDLALVEYLAPLSDPKDGDSHAMRDALRAGHWDVVQELWPHSDPNSGAGEPLALAARDGDLQRLRWMISHGADPQAGKSGALRALIHNAPSAPMSAFEFLWGRSNPAHLEPQDLLAAVKGNRPEWVAKIIPHVDVDARDAIALKTAARMGELELLEALIPATDPIKAESIIKAEEFEDDAEAMLLAMIPNRALDSKGPGSSTRTGPR